MKEKQYVILSPAFREPGTEQLAIKTISRGRGGKEQDSGMHPRPLRPSSTQWNEAQAAQELATWRRLLPLGPLQHYPERHAIFTQGDMPRDVFILARGIVKLTCDLPDGKRSLFALRYPGQILEECAFDLKLPYPVSAATVLPCEIHRLEAGRMIEAAQRNPEVNAFENLVLKRNLYNEGVALVEFKTLPRDDLLERFLWNLAAVQGARARDGQVRFILPLRNIEMAEWLGISESHYKQMRAALEEAGVLQRDGKRFVLRQR